MIIIKNQTFTFIAILWNGIQKINNIIIYGFECPKEIGLEQWMTC